MVSTYGDIAKALGDVRASRAVGTVLASNFSRPIAVPCHRVVYGDGRTGWYAGHGKGRGEEDRAAPVRGRRGSSMAGSRTSSGSHFKAFKIPSNLKELAEEQERLQGLVSERTISPVRNIAGGIGRRLSRGRRLCQPGQDEA